MRYLAVDPGKATGVAFYDSENGRFWSAEVPEGTVGFAHWWDKIGYLTLPSVVICEKFTIGAKSGFITSQYDALEINGFLRGTCAINGIEFKQQLVSGVKAFSTNDKLRTLGWFKAGAGHADDASRHMLAFLANRPEGQYLLEKILND